MHRAYEVAFCAAFMFGGSRPRFSEIDEVRRDTRQQRSSSIEFGCSVFGWCIFTLGDAARIFQPLYVAAAWKAGCAMQV